MVGDLVAALVVLFILLFCIFMLVKTSKAKKRGARERAQKMLKFNAQEIGLMQHIYGLDVPEDALCEVCICQDKYVFIRNHTDINLAFDKVTDVSIKTNRDIQTQYVSSAGGAIGGALMFGALGAIIGGRTKKKTDVSTTTYLIIAYDKNGGTSYICFLIQNPKFAQKCVRAFENSPSFHRKKSIDL